MKAYLTRFFKHYTVLFLMSLLVTNCEKNDDLIKHDDKTQIQLNLAKISERLNYGSDNLYIDWYSPKILNQNKKEMDNVIQYPILFKNPVRNNTELFTEHSQLYLIISENLDKQDVTVLHYQPFNYSSNTTPSKTNIENYSGMLSEFNAKGQQKEIYVFENGKEITTFSKSNPNKSQSSDLFSYAYANDFDDCVDLYGRPFDDCVPSGGGGGSGGFVMQITRHFVDWYNMCNSCNSNDGYIYTHTDGNKYIYVKTKYTGATINWVWVSSGSNNVYNNYYTPKSGTGSSGPSFNNNEEREYTPTSDEDVGELLPCPIGFEKIGNDCVKIDEDEIINQLTGKEKCIYDKLENLNLFKTTIKKFENSNSYNLTLKYGSCNSGGEACTNADDISNGNITINFVYGSNNIPLEFAARILHEGIHAELFKYVDEYQNGVDPNDRPLLLKLYAYYKGWAEDTQDEEYNWKNDAHHQYMVENYVKSIAKSIRKLDGYKYSLDYYMAYGWDGLAAYGYTSKKLSNQDYDYYQNLRAVTNSTSELCD